VEDDDEDESMCAKPPVANTARNNGMLDSSRIGLCMFMLAIVTINPLSLALGGAQSFGSKSFAGRHESRTILSNGDAAGEPTNPIFSDKALNCSNFSFSVLNAWCQSYLWIFFKNFFALKCADWTF